MPAHIKTWIEWYCPECKKTDQTGLLPPNASRMHKCPKLAGIVAPLQRKGTKSRLEVVQREDYVGNETVTLDDQKRPVMAVRVMREGGMDVAVFAPVARISANS